MKDPAIFIVLFCLFSLVSSRLGFDEHDDPRVRDLKKKKNADSGKKEKKRKCDLDQVEVEGGQCNWSGHGVCGTNNIYNLCDKCCDGNCYSNCGEEICRCCRLATRTCNLCPQLREANPFEDTGGIMKKDDMKEKKKEKNVSVPPVTDAPPPISCTKIVWDPAYCFPQTPSQLYLAPRNPACDEVAKIKKCTPQYTTDEECTEYIESLSSCACGGHCPFSSNTSPISATSAGKTGEELRAAKRRAGNMKLHPSFDNNDNNDNNDYNDNNHNNDYSGLECEDF
ncbi:hypothetical protein TrLO_g6961 [Triparma laevis f. longispina]|uniref:Uncharacterized protein n=1 Tax=Triparma laevis f. longispina TaxID=1714387 RepID=A0A9W7APK2_9STRA|nr:hypothetical protein TrLO_g6961 [Triparma laevis f. longispina]